MSRPLIRKPGYSVNEEQYLNERIKRRLFHIYGGIIKLINMYFGRTRRAHIIPVPSSIVYELRTSISLRRKIVPKARAIEEFGSVESYGIPQRLESGKHRPADPTNPVLSEENGSETRTRSGHVDQSATRLHSSKKVIETQ